MPVLDEPQSGEVSKRILGRTSKSCPKVGMQETISRTALEDFSTAMARQSTFRLTDGSVVGKNRTKKHVFGTKETLEQFFSGSSGSSGLPRSSAYNEVDQHVQASSVSLSSDRRPRQSPSDLPTSSKPFIKVIDSLPSLQRTEVTDPCSINSNVIEPAGVCEVSYETPVINIPIYSTSPPGADASYFLNCSLGSSGGSRIPPQMNNYPMCSFAVSVDASPPQTRLLESEPSCSNYAVDPFQGNCAPHINQSSPPIPHSAEASALVHPFLDPHGLNSGNIVRRYDLGNDVSETHQYAVQAERPSPYGKSNESSNNSDFNSVNSLPLRIVRDEVDGVVQFVCYDPSSGERRGPVDVTDVLLHFLDRFTESLAPAKVDLPADYHTGFDSTYFGTDDEGSIATSPATSISSPLSANPDDIPELQSTNHYPFFT